METLIHSEEQITEFLKKVYPELEPHEALFMSLSCRNKYLNAERRNYYKLCGTEMFARQVIPTSEPNMVLNWLKRFRFEYRHLHGYTSKNNQNLPFDAMVCYANINPTDGLQVAEQTMKYLSESFSKIVRHGEKELHNTKKLTNKVNTFYQQSRSRKLWIDIDFDINKFNPDHLSALSTFWGEMYNRGVETIGIDTRSGYHIMLRKEDLKFNYNALVKTAHDTIQSTGNGECIVNKNEMVPLPGTFQAAYPVQLMKEIQL